jgi:hypothetical protein
LRFASPVSVGDIQKLFRSWNWSWKIPTEFQISKYSPENMLRYYNYLYWLHHTPWRQIKFLDEVHFQAKSLVCRRVVGLRGTRTVRVSHASLDERLTATTLLTPQNSQKPLTFWIREESNDQWDFFEFLVSAVEEGSLKSGDILVIDNAAVHAGMDSYPLLNAFLEASSIQIVFLPAYSPELNPTELVFGFVKNFLRKYRHSTDSLKESIIFAFGQVSCEMILRFYSHCASF